MSTGDRSELRDRTTRLVDRRRGILALDTPPSVLATRLLAADVLPAAATTDAYLRMLLETPELAADTSGVVLTAAVLAPAPGRRPTRGAPVAPPAGILVGARADTGHEAIASGSRGRVTSGLDGLGSRLGRMRDVGVDFAVWSVCTPLADDPDALRNLTVNCQAAARFATTCQALGVIPLIRVGTRTPSASPGRRRMALASALLSVVGHLEDVEVDVAATVVTTACDTDPTHPGAAGPLSTLPPHLGGVALCPARSPARPVDDAVGDAFAALSAAPPWPVTFYVGREATGPALSAWRGRTGSVQDGQRALRSRLAAAAAALAGGRHLHTVLNRGAG
jgi:fructose-bisphosphate aldolase, class I